MKIILSRKGFDGSNGGLPSVIDGENMYSFPIPDEKDVVSKYSDLMVDGKPLDIIMGKYYKKICYSTGKKIDLEDKPTCHPDPNLVNYFNQDKEAFLGSIGQEGSAQGHLYNNKVGVGDLFLFFGWFKKYEDGKLKAGNGKHILYGYLQVGEKIDVNGLTSVNREQLEKKNICLEKQPHWDKKYKSKNSNYIYIARPKLEILGEDTELPGYGVFKYSPKLELTKDNQEYLTHWELPKELQGFEITYCTKQDASKDYFQAAPRGQELIVHKNNDNDLPSAVEEWVRDLIKEHIKL